MVNVLLVLQVGHCYLQQLSTFPQELSELLLSHHTVLEPDLRMVRLSVSTGTSFLIHVKQLIVLVAHNFVDIEMFFFVCFLSDLLQSADSSEE